MKPLLFTLGGASAEGLGAQLGAQAGTLEQRSFPDGESYVRFETPVASRDVILLCPLDRPDDKALRLLFAADAARQQGAARVGLVAPYLAYMRQDKAFRDGEAITSRTFAGLVSQSFDWLVTVDPHLHRYPDLAAVYSIPAVAASAAAPIAQWIASHVANPILLGPDEESGQWVRRIADLASARSAVFHKSRAGDFDVSIAGRPAPLPPGATPVIVDDIASSATTMIETVRLLKAAGQPPPVCIVVHPIFAADAYDRLQQSGPAAILSTNTIAHPSNRIDVTAELATAVSAMLARPNPGRAPDGDPAGSAAG